MSLQNFFTTLPEVSEIWTRKQRDTYYRIPKGRLKLREEIGSVAQLIFYQRNNSVHARMSDYYIYQTNESEILNSLMNKALGTRVIISKTRKLLMYRNVRIHLDRVDGLGAFLELESVLDKHHNEQTAKDNLRDLQKCLSDFSLIPIEKSYADLLEQKRRDG